jgi:hypothetical protein
VTILLDIAPEAAAARKLANRDRYERDLGLLTRVRESYRRQSAAPTGPSSTPIVPKMTWRRTWLRPCCHGSCDRKRAHRPTPASFNTSAHTPIVAPVVITSSMRTSVAEWSARSRRRARARRDG